MFKKSIARDEIHKAVKARLEEITPSKDIIALFDNLFKEQRQIERGDEADIELKRLLISNIFNNTLSYSKEKGLRTKEIPLVYAKNPDIATKINLNKKSPLRTANSLVETLSYSNSDPLVEVRRVELRSKRHAYKLLPL